MSNVSDILRKFIQFITYINLEIKSKHMPQTGLLEPKHNFVIKLKIKFNEEMK